MASKSLQKATRLAPVSLPRFIFKRGSSYAVRYSVPTELQKAAGEKEVVRGFGTKCLK
ncbi:DUF6538 domain-containing protein [Albidovulum litorale]|uniref:DUF6538 domain-containing protein n=1 Tax=Albidovulum litorale TaxID=2984134 RepID=UPI003991C01C